jgi:spore germination protein KC
MTFSRSPLVPLRIRLLGLLAFALACLPLQGCWDRTEINDITIILAMGIDRIGKNQVQVSAQIFIPRQSGGGTGSISGDSGGSPNNTTVVQTAEGANIAEAVNLLQRKLSRHVFWGHCEAIVFGKEAAARGIRSYLDFLLRYNQIREHAYVYFSDKPAKDILGLLPPLERSSAEVLREMGNMKLGTRVTVLNLAGQIQGNSQTAILSRLGIVTPEVGKNPTATMPYVRGLALFDKDRYVKSIDLNKTIGYLLIINQLENFIFSIKTGQGAGYISIQGKKIHTTLIPRIRDGKWTMTISIKMTGEVALLYSNESLIIPQMQKDIERLWAQHMQKMAESALMEVQKEMKLDLFHFADEYDRHYPIQWQQAKKNWDRLFPTIETAVTVEAKLDRIGKSSSPQGIPQESTKTK